jgi:hypothetical protein
MKLLPHFGALEDEALVCRLSRQWPAAHYVRLCFVSTVSYSKHILLDINQPLILIATCSVVSE